MIKIFYEDKFLVVCEKAVGVLSEEVNRKRNMPEILRAETGAYNIFTLHRLDKAVGGVMVYAKSKKATPKLSADFREHRVTKEYLAVVKGEPRNDSGVFEDFLFRDSKNNKSYVVKTLRRGAKTAKLEYSLIDKAKIGDQTFSLVKIKLFTGRTHQIRVQFSSRKMPLLGDEKYGGKDKKCNISLWSAHLSFSHPITGEMIDCVSLPPDKYPFNLFGGIDKVFNKR